MKRTDITALFPDATDEQIDKIMNLNGADINKAKGDLEDLRGKFADMQNELTTLKQGGSDKALQEATERAAALQNELDSIKRGNAIRDIRDKVAGEMKVPASLLTGETEEACAEQAKAIMEFAKANPQGYPVVKDGGEARNTLTTATRDKFAEWAKDNL